ncbi:MAG: DUF3299 domain-containing protein [Chloroflexi bacterium]|nr:DUF3299 domain-containing protein [Chloroflexota bacterium]
MDRIERTKHNSVLILVCMLMLFTVSCASAEESVPPAAENTTVPASEQPVEYGASLSEWEDATQTDTTPTMSPAEPKVEATAPPATAVAETMPTATIASNQVTPSAEATVPPPTEEPVATEEPTPFVLNDIIYQEIMWDGLVPTDFTPDAIMAKYQDQLAQFEDGSKDAVAVYEKMQEEFNDAPVNEALNETFVRIPGFIAPLEYTDNIITEFLLVPYFGACIHTPPPPANQTVLVVTDDGQGIKPEDAYNPIWVMGKLTTDGTTTELAQAGYFIQDAVIEPYTSP